MTRVRSRSVLSLPVPQREEVDFGLYLQGGTATPPVVRQDTELDTQIERAQQNDDTVRQSIQ